ncbi:tRNA (adenosine(37)-N6)-threonylcarbamoyltransferase complex ATPase subunit type 1 TsaE [Patescibacteria group bacterium]|nr:tRNA (adenosine(37)-N6)-threonylcarbamoyltransferase complex ATPase subunit type 1 TsaE [Patescibacteria group bacterium]
MDYQTHHSKTAAQTHRLGQEAGVGLTSGRVFCLNGELGSGKTVFAQGLARGVGLEERVLSPTFILMREYDLNRPGLTRFYHLDFYRLERKEEVISLGLEEIFADLGAVVVIEWADKIKVVLPARRTEVSLKVGEDERREIKVREVSP